MPIYEYRCQGCGRRVALFFRSISGASQPRCPHCGSGDLTRLVSQVAVLRPWGESLDWVPDAESLDDVDEDSPQEVARWARRLREEMGEGAEEWGPEEDYPGEPEEGEE